MNTKFTQLFERPKMHLRIVSVPSKGRFFRGRCPECGDERDDPSFSVSCAKGVVKEGFCTEGCASKWIRANYRDYEAEDDA